MQVIGRLIAALSGAALLYGCASLVEPDSGAISGPGPAELDSFRLDGKVSWRAPDRRGRASLTWDEALGRTRMVISGPFGSGTAVLEEDLDGARLQLGDRIARDIDAGRLLERELGLRLPVRAARDWVLGRPSSKEAVVTMWEEGGQIGALEEAGWSVRFERYTLVEGFILPGRIEMKRGAYVVRFVATRWRPGRAEFAADG